MKNKLFKTILVLVLSICLFGCNKKAESNTKNNDTNNINNREVNKNNYPWVRERPYQIMYKLDDNGDFLMMVDTYGWIYENNTYSLSTKAPDGSSLAIFGKIINGSVSIGDKVQLIGYPLKTEDNYITTTVEEIIRFDTIFGNEPYFDLAFFNATMENVQKAYSADAVGVILKDVNTRDVVERGQVLAKPGSINLHKKFEANIYYDSETNSEPLNINDEYYCYFRNAEYKCNIAFEENQVINPGDTIKVNVEFDYMGVPFNNGDEFIIRSHGTARALATVLEITE